MRTSRRGWSVLFALALLHCGGDPAGPVFDPPVLKLGLTSTFVGPKEPQQVSLTVIPTPGDALQEGWLVFRGGVVDSISLPEIHGIDPVQALVNVALPQAPLTAQVLVYGNVRTAHGAYVTDTAFAIGDTTPPSLSLGYGWPTTAAPGDTLRLGSTAFDVSGLRQAALHLSGAIDTTVTVAISTYSPVLDLYGEFVVPPGATTGDSITGTVTAVDLYDIADTLHAAPIHIVGP